VANYRNFRRVEMLRKRINSVSQLARTHHEAIAIIVFETSGLLAMKSEHLSQRMEFSGRAVTTMYQYVDRLARIDLQRARRTIVARTEPGNVHQSLCGGQASRICGLDGIQVTIGGAATQGDDQ